MNWLRSRLSFALLISALEEVDPSSFHHPASASSMATWAAIVIAVCAVSRAASDGCSLSVNATSGDDAVIMYGASCDCCKKRCAKWTINVTSYSSPLGGRCAVLPCLLNPASWDPDAINVTADLGWLVSGDGTHAFVSLVNGQAIIEISCYLDWWQSAPFAKALIVQAASLPFPTATTPSGSNLSPNVTTVIDKLPQSSADELYTHFPPTTPTGHETTIEIISSLAATPLTTPVLPTSSDGVDEILLEPASVTLLPSDGNAVFRCRMKTKDPFVIINDSLTYPGTLINDVTISAASSDDRQYWNVTVTVSATRNSTMVQCLSMTGNATSEAILVVVGPPLPPNPRLLLPFDVSAVQITWQKPFTWSSVADVTQYTVRVFSTADYIWSTMNIQVGGNTNDTFFVCNFSIKMCTPQGQHDTSTDPLTYYVQINGITHGTSCYTIQFYVSAINAVGESDTMLADKDFVVGPLSKAAPQFTVTPLFRPNGDALIVTEIQAPRLCSGQIVSYSIFVTNASNVNIYALNLTKTFPHCNVISVTDVVSGYSYKVMVIESTFGVSTNSSNPIYAPARWSSSVRPSPSSTVRAMSGSAQGCQVQNSIVAAVSGLLGLLLIAACVASAALMWRIRARRKKILAPPRVERCNPLYELGMSHPYEQVTMKLRPLPAEPSSPNEDRYFMSPHDRSSRDISLPECQKTETEIESPTTDIKTGVMVL